MGVSKDHIRGLSIAIIKNNGRILVSPGHDKIKDERFFRLIGGGIEFGENSLEALKREMKEELNTELINYKLVATLENIFTFNGEPGHEICFIYEADFKDPANYKIEEFMILDNKEGGRAIWLDIDGTKDKNIFPDGVANFL
ncbi:MAG: NUDIX hydrolase [Patescibacteria group bacterium]|jgi:8-oxo-dGTP pyrophosphatase MutT (NUDIX family)